MRIRREGIGKMGVQGWRGEGRDNASAERLTWVTL